MLIKLKLGFAGFFVKDYEVHLILLLVDSVCSVEKGIRRVTSGFFLLILKSILLSISQYSANSESNICCPFVLLHVHETVPLIQ